VTSVVAVPRRAMAARSSGPLLPLVLWLAAAVISGFTIRRYLEPFDEGLLLQAATRMADGEWPYADFGWAYGPGQPLLVAAAFKAFGPSVIAWRVLRVVADATIALLVWDLVRREAGPRWALAGWLAATVTIAQPTTANPTPVALALALGAVTAAVHRRAVPAGALTALTLFWRPDLGLVTLLAVTATLVKGGQTPLVTRGSKGGLTPLVTRGSKGGQTPWVTRGRGGLTPLVTRGSKGGQTPLGVAVGVGVVGAVVLYAPFAIAAGPSALWDSLVSTGMRDGAAWRLPFPLEYDGPLRGWPPGTLAEDLKDVLGFYLPLIAVAGLALTAISLLARRPPRLTPAIAGLGVLALGTLGYLLSRTDELHAQPLLVVLCALLPIAAAGLERGILLIVPLVLILLAGAANRVSALALPPDLEPVRLDGVPGIRVPPEEARALPPLVAAVQELVPEGEPIYVAPRRSDLVTLTDPLLHFLVRRPNVLDRDALLQAKPEEQERIVAALERARPRAVIRWLDPLSSKPEPNDRGRPSGSTALDDYLASNYEPRARYGAYEILVPR
jgi:hypothetical protein